MSGKFLILARQLDDLIIDRLLQPGVNRADWHLGLTHFTLARLSLVLGAGIGLIWIHRFDTLFSSDFLQDMLSVVMMSWVAFRQITSHEAKTPHRPAVAPAVRLTGLFWRTLWLAVLASFVVQVPVEAPAELVGNFVWATLLVLPYWLICCRVPPSAPRHVAGELRYASIPVR